MKTRPLFFLAGILLFFSMSALAEGACWNDSLARVDGEIVSYYEIRNADAPEIVRAVGAR